MKIVILSGKGGTGKSTITSSLALSLSKEKSLVLVDADADCPNQHIIFPGKLIRKQALKVSKIAVVDKTKKNTSKKPEEVCRFDAIKVANESAIIDRFKCEGCGACVLVNDAITLQPKLAGELIIKQTESFPLVYGKLEPGESGSGKVVFEAKKAAQEVASKTNADLTLIDAPAGIGCPVIAAVTGSDYAIGVVEPTPASIANLERAMEVVEHFNIPYSVILNKAGISEKYEKMIAEKFQEKLIAQIPYDENVPYCLAEGIPPIKGKGEAAKALEDMVKKVKRIL
jgi:MinD superfamily P-loop ATPase